MVTDEHHEADGGRAAGEDRAHDHALAADAHHSSPHHAHAFDPEPSREIASDEPQTPMWLPALGLALFVAFGLYLALGSDDEPTVAAPTATATATAVPPTPAAANPRSARPVSPPRAVRRPPAPAATGTGSPLDRLTPEQRQQLEQRLRQMREQRGQKAAPAAPGRDPHEGHGH